MDLKKIKKALAAADRIAAEEIQLERKRSGLAIRKLAASREMLKMLGKEMELMFAPPPKVTRPRWPKSLPPPGTRFTPLAGPLRKAVARKKQ